MVNDIAHKSCELNIIIYNKRELGYCVLKLGGGIVRGGIVLLKSGGGNVHRDNCPPGETSELEMSAGGNVRDSKLHTGVMTEVLQASEDVGEQVGEQWVCR